MKTTTQHMHIHKTEKEPYLDVFEEPVEQLVTKHVGDICGGTGRYYVARTHWHGYKKWNVKSQHVSYNAAVKAMALAFVQDRSCNRADVILCADYYDPIQVCELRR